MFTKFLVFFIAFSAVVSATNVQPPKGQGVRHHGTSGQGKRSLISDLEAPVKQIFKTLSLREVSDVHYYDARHHGHHHHSHHHTPNKGAVGQGKRNILSDIEAPFKEIVQKLGLRDESEGLSVIEPAIDQEKRSLISDLEAPVKQIFKTLGLREVSDVHHYDARHHGHHHHGHHHTPNKGAAGQGKRNILSDIEAPFKEIVQKLGLRELTDAQKRGVLSDIEAPFKEIGQRLGLREVTNTPGVQEPPRDDFFNDGYHRLNFYRRDY